MSTSSEEIAQPNIYLRDVSLTFGSTEVFHSLSLSVPLGHRILLLGANGAGKSSLLRLLAGLIPANSGDYSVFNPVGYLGHKPGLYSALTVRENLSLFNAITPCSTSSRFDQLVQLWQLETFLERPVSNLSKGMAQRVALCRLGLLQPSLYLLDEPTAPLDDSGVGGFRDFLLGGSDVSQKASYLIATHDIARLQEIATAVIVLHNSVARLWLGIDQIPLAINFYHSCNR